jgi:hypothetical protein
VVFSRGAIAAPRWRVSVVVAGAALMYASMVVVQVPSPALGGLPWTLVSGAYLFVSSQTLQTC